MHECRAARAVGRSFDGKFPARGYVIIGPYALTVSTGQPGDPRDTESAYVIGTGGSAGPWPSYLEFEDQGAGQGYLAKIVYNPGNPDVVGWCASRVR